MPTVGPVRPIRPEDIEKLKKDLLPNEVVEAFNEMIAKNYNNGHSSFKQSEVVALMISKGLKKAVIFDQHYLDIEVLYSKRWDVDYDKSVAPDPPSPSTFTFTAKRGR